MVYNGMTVAEWLWHALVATKEPVYFLQDKTDEITVLNRSCKNIPSVAEP